MDSKTSKAIDIYEILQEESKNVSICVDMDKLLKANLVLLSWIKGVDGKDVSEERKRSLRNDLNTVLYLFESHKKLEQENFTLQRDNIHLKHLSDREALAKENISLKVSLINLTDQIVVLGKQNGRLLKKYGKEKS